MSALTLSRLAQRAEQQAAHTRHVQLSPVHLLLALLSLSEHSLPQLPRLLELGLTADSVITTFESSEMAKLARRYGQPGPSIAYSAALRLAEEDESAAPPAVRLLKALLKQAADHRYDTLGWVITEVCGHEPQEILDAIS